MNFCMTTTQQLERLQKENENLRAEIVVLCPAVARHNRVESSKVKLLDTKSFSGATSAIQLDNFIWDMEQYFPAARVPNADKLNITTM